VIQDAEVEHDIELSHVRRVERHVVGDQRFDPAVAGGAGEIESAFTRQLLAAPQAGDSIEALRWHAGGPAVRLVAILRLAIQRPGEPVAGHDARGAALLGDEAVESIPRSDVEDRLAAQIRQMEGLELLRLILRRLDSRRHDATPQID
jgi:hypothetical protein